MYNVATLKILQLTNELNRNKEKYKFLVDLAEEKKTIIIKQNNKHQSGGIAQ